MLETRIVGRNWCRGKLRKPIATADSNGGGGEALVESGANALAAFKCCIENKRRANFLD